MTVKEAKNSASDLAHVVFGYAIQLRREVVIVALIRQTYSRSQVNTRHAAVGVAHCLVPQKLERISILRYAIFDCIGTTDWWTVCTSKVFGLQPKKVVKSAQHHLGVSVFFATNCKHIKQHWPNQVVDTEFFRIKPVGHRIVCVGRCWCDLDVETCNTDTACRIKCIFWRNESVGMRSMRRVAIKLTKANIDYSVSAVKRECDCELLDQSATICGRNLRSCAQSIECNLLVSPDRY